ncbi:MAG: tetratricopeptide repeat protein [Desulfosoma sp.]
MANRVVCRAMKWTVNRDVLQVKRSMTDRAVCRPLDEKEWPASCPGGRGSMWLRRGCALALFLSLGLCGTPGILAQESNQAALIHVEKSAQAHLLMPKPLAVPGLPSLPLEASPQAGVRSLQVQPEEGLSGLSVDIPRIKLTIAWGYYNQGRYQDAALLFDALTGEDSVPNVVEESRLGLAYSMIRLNRLNEAAQLLEDMVAQGVRLRETVPALVETLLGLKRYADAEKYLPLLP